MAEDEVVAVVMGSSSHVNTSEIGIGSSSGKGWSSSNSSSGSSGHFNTTCSEIGIGSSGRGWSSSKGLVTNRLQY